MTFCKKFKLNGSHRSFVEARPYNPFEESDENLLFLEEGRSRTDYDREASVVLRGSYGREWCVTKEHFSNNYSEVQI